MWLCRMSQAIELGFWSKKHTTDASKRIKTASGGMASVATEITPLKLLKKKNFESFSTGTLILKCNIEITLL